MKELDSGLKTNIDNQTVIHIDSFINQELHI